MSKGTMTHLIIVLDKTGWCYFKRWYIKHF